MNNYRPDAANKTFDYKYDPKETNAEDALNEAKKHINTTVTQLFYTSAGRRCSSSKVHPSARFAFTRSSQSVWPTNPTANSTRHSTVFLAPKQLLGATDADADACRTLP